VREDLGFPPLVTPSSQIVGTQAVLNVLAGERYKTITNEVKRYLQGGYGQPPAAVNEDVRQKAIGNEELMECRPADHIAAEMDRLTNEIGDLATNAEDVLTFAMFPDIGKRFLEERREGTLKPEALLPKSDAKPQEGGAPTEFNINLHGETYQIAITGIGGREDGSRQIYLSVDGMPEEVILEPLSHYAGAPSGRKQANLPGHITTAMPGNIVDVLVKEGDKVKIGQAVLITEAMKMETEIQTPVAGTVKAVHVIKGDRITPGEILVEIE